MPWLFYYWSKYFHGRKRRFLNITGQMSNLSKGRNFHWTIVTQNAAGLGISKWQFKIYFYLTYELDVELVIYWMCRLLCLVNQKEAASHNKPDFSGSSKWGKILEIDGRWLFYVNDQRIIHCFIPSQELLTFINCLFETIDKELHKWHFTIGNFHLYIWKFDNWKFTKFH